MKVVPTSSQTRASVAARLGNVAILAAVAQASMSSRWADRQTDGSPFGFGVSPMRTTSPEIGFNFSSIR